MTRIFGRSMWSMAIKWFALCACVALVQAQTIVPKQVQQLLTKRFPQVKVGACNDDDMSPLVYRDTAIYSKNGNISIHGSDHFGNPWTAKMEISPMSECQVWTSDLGNNQRQDLLILVMGLNSSGGADSQLSLLVFDDNGLPLPWQAIGSFTSDADGVLQVVRPDSNKAAQIIVPKQEGIGNISRAYHLFGVAGNSIDRAIVSGSDWPFLSSTSKEFTHEQQAYAPWGPDRNSVSSNVMAASRITITEIKNQGSMQDEQLVLSNKQVLRYPKIIMIDRPNKTRAIDFDPTQIAIKQLKNSNAAVQVYGTTCDGGFCQPLLLWAKE